MFLSTSGFNRSPNKLVVTDCLLSKGTLSRIRGVVANYLASQARDPGIDSHQHLKDS